MGNQLAAFAGSIIGASLDILGLAIAFAIAIPSKAQPWTASLAVTIVVTFLIYAGIGFVFTGGDFVRPRLPIYFMASVIWGCIAVGIIRAIRRPTSAPK